MLSEIIKKIEASIEDAFISTHDFENWDWGKGKADMEIECNNTLYHIDYSLWGYKKVVVSIDVFNRMSIIDGKKRYFPANKGTAPETELLSHAFVYLLRDRYDELEKEEELLKIEEERSEKDHAAMQETYASLEKQFYPQQF